MRTNVFLFIVALGIFGFASHSQAALGLSGISYASSTSNLDVTGHAVTIVVIGTMNSTTSAATALSQLRAGAGYVFAIGQRGGGGGNLESCGANDGVGASGAKKPNYGKLQAWVCTADNAGTINFYVFDVKNGTLYDSGTDPENFSAGTGLTGLVVGSVGPTQKFPGTLNTVYTLNRFLTQNQAKSLILTMNPYTFGQPTFFCPFAAQASGNADMRCFTPSKLTFLTPFNTPTSVWSSLAMYPF